MRKKLFIYLLFCITQAFSMEDPRLLKHFINTIQNQNNNLNTEELPIFNNNDSNFITASTKLIPNSNPNQIRNQNQINYNELSSGPSISAATNLILIPNPVQPWNHSQINNELSSGPSISAATYPIPNTNPVKTGSQMMYPINFNIINSNDIAIIKPGITTTNSSASPFLAIVKVNSTPPTKKRKVKHSKTTSQSNGTIK